MSNDCFACLLTLPEGNAVDDIVRLVVYKFQLYVFLTSADDFACSIVVHVVCAEDRLRVVGAVGSKLFQVAEEFACYVAEVEGGFNLYSGVGLFGTDVLRYIFFEFFLECG